MQKMPLARWDGLTKPGAARFSPNEGFRYIGKVVSGLDPMLAD
jgi:hypothetical protein